MSRETSQVPWEASLEAGTFPEGRPPESPSPAEGDQRTSPPGTDRVLAEIADGLFHLRRAWAKPVIERMQRQPPGGRPLHLSNLMVVYAVDAVPARPAIAPDGQRERGERGQREVNVGDVAERLEIDPSTASRLVGHAIDAGLVSRRPSPADARRADLRLTDAGRRVKLVADRYRQRYLDTLLAEWSDDERRQFARMLTRFADAATCRPMDLSGVGRIFAEAGSGPAAGPMPGDHHQGGR